MMATVTPLDAGPHVDKEAKYTSPDEREDEWRKLPRWAREALLEWAEGYGVTRPLRYAIVRAEKEEKKWSRAWFVSVQTDEESVVDLRLTFGRGLSSVREETEPD